MEIKRFLWENLKISLLIAVIKHDDESHLKEKELVLAHGSDVQSITVGKLVWQELKAAGYIIFRIEQREMNAGMFTFSVVYIQDPTQGMEPPSVSGSSYFN